MHNKIMKNYLIYYFYLFFLGGQAYCTIEMLWRGRTHYSMFFAGGIIFIFLVYLQHEMKSAHVIEKCLLGSVFITATEFIFGCVSIFNTAWPFGITTTCPAMCWGRFACLTQGCGFYFASFSLNGSLKTIFTADLSA